MRSSREALWPVACLLAIACAVRLLLSLKVSPDLLIADQDEYLSGAQRLLNGQTLAIKNSWLFIRPPGYSTFIAGVWTLTGTRSLTAIKIAQALLDTATCGYLYRMAREMSSRRWAPLFALAAAALYPYLIYYTATIHAETLFAFLLVSGTYYFARGFRTRNLRDVALGSLVLSLGNLVRANFTVVLPFIGIWLVWRWWHNKRRLIAIAAAIAVPLFTVTLPWNYAVWRQGLGVVWVTDGGGINFYEGQNDLAARLYCEDPPLEERIKLIVGESPPPPEYALARQLAPKDQQKVYWHSGWNWFRSHLHLLPCLVPQKIYSYWRPYVHSEIYSRKMVLLSLVSVPILLLGSIGGWRAWRRGERELTMLALLQAIAGTLAVMFLSVPQIRYRVPVTDAALLAFFGEGMVALFGRKDHDFALSSSSSSQRE